MAVALAALSGDALSEVEGQDLLAHALLRAVSLRPSAQAFKRGPFHLSNELFEMP